MSKILLRVRDEVCRNNNLWVSDRQDGEANDLNNIVVLIIDIGDKHKILIMINGEI